MEEFRIVIPKNKSEKANINGTLTNDTDFIMKALNMVIDDYIDFKKEKQTDILKK
jgi:hypothetical protein